VSKEPQNFGEAKKQTRAEQRQAFYERLLEKNSFNTIAHEKFVV